jgi:hypothetical protein
MFDTINGLPVHTLVVHAIVVLLPLAVLGTIAIAVRPRWRRPYGPLVVAAAAIATVLIPVATKSGEKLETHVGVPSDHAHLGHQLIFFAVPLFLLVTALVVLDRRAEGGRTPDGGRPTSDGGRAQSRPTPVTAIAVLAVVAGLAAGVQVYRVGDSGARAAWGQLVKNHVNPTP